MLCLLTSPQKSQECQTKTLNGEPSGDPSMVAGSWFFWQASPRTTSFTLCPLSCPMCLGFLNRPPPIHKERVLPSTQVKSSGDENDENENYTMNWIVGYGNYNTILWHPIYPFLPKALSMTLAKSTFAVLLPSIPRSCRCSSATARAHRSNALEGTQPTFKQSPAGHVAFETSSNSYDGYGIFTTGHTRNYVYRYLSRFWGYPKGAWCQWIGKINQQGTQSLKWTNCSYSTITTIPYHIPIHTHP